MRLLNKGMIVLLPFLLMIGACSTPNNNPGGEYDLYLAVALETTVGTLVSLEATGVLPPEGAKFITTTLNYAGESCKILQDPTLDEAEKRVKLTIELADERQDFDAAFSNLTKAQLDKEVLLAIIPAINGARAAARIALTRSVDPENYKEVCASAEQLQASWNVQHPVSN